MAEKSNIAWTDSTINFWSGCTKVSAGCANCYAEGLSNRRMTTKDGQGIIGEWGPGGIRRKSKSAVKDALRLNAKPWICDNCGDTAIVDKRGNKTTGMCQYCGTTTFHRRRIFSLSLGDWLEGPPVKVIDSVPFGGVPTEWRYEMLHTVWRCAAVHWILCSKRWEKWMAALAWVACSEHTEFTEWLRRWMEGEPPENVTILASVENQATADARIPALLRIPAARRGLSLEPLLGPVDLSKWLQPVPQLDWLIVGGES